MTADPDDFDDDFLRRAVDRARLAILETDSKSRIVRANRHAARLFGYADAPGLMAGIAHARQLYARESDRDWLRAKLAKGEDVSNVVIELRRRDGSTFWALHGVDAKLGPDGAIAGVVGWIADVGSAFQGRRFGAVAPAPIGHHMAESDFLAQLFAASDTGIYETAPDGMLSRANPALARMFGFADVDEMCGAMAAGVGTLYAHPADRARALEILQREGRLHDALWQAKRRDGATFWVRESALRVAGPPERFIGTLTDVTALVEAWAEVRRAEASYRSLFENAAHGMYRTTPDGRQLRANPALVRLNGYSNETELLAAVNDIATEWYVDPGRRDEFKRLVETHGRVRNFESEIYRHKTRERIWISESAWVVRGQDGRVLYYEGMVEDITERKRVERAFVAAKAEAEMLAADYRSIYDNANVGIFRTLPGGRQTRSNSALARLNGFATPEEQIAAVAAAISGNDVTGWYVEPDRRAAYLREMAANGRVENFVSEVRRRGTGEQAWVSENAWAVRDATGEIVAYEGTVIDVTERVRAERALAAAKAEAERLAEDYRSIYDNANVGIYRTAIDGRVERISLAMAHLNGFRTVEENFAAIETPEIGRSSRGWYADPARREEIRRMLLERGRIEDVVSEIRRRATGEPAWVRENAWIVRDAAGAPVAIEGTLVDVTELMRSQGDLAAAKAEAERLAADYRSIYDNAVLGVYRCAADGRLLRANPALVAFDGYANETEWLAGTADAGESWYVDPGRRATFREMLLRDGRVQNLESEVRRHKTGERVWVSESAWTVHDASGEFLYFEGLVVDITARKRAEAALREAKAEAERLSEEYRSIFENANFGIYRTDAQWRQTRVNPALARLNGLTVDEQIAVSKQRAESEGWYVEAGRRAVFRAIMAREGRVAGFESEIARRRGGDRIWISENAWTVRDREGEIVAFEGMVEDITARKRAEAALREAKAEAEAASAAKSAFLAVMSHELRTPLNAIIGFAEIVAGRLFGPDDPRYFEYAEHIRQSGTHLLTLINDILDLSKIGAGQFDLHESEVDLAVLADDTAKLFGASAGKGGVALALAPDFPALRLRADALRLKQVAMNLVSNAIKFTKPGGRVTVGAAVDAEAIRFWVEDTGIGMTEREAKRAMEPFVQIDDGLARKHGGTGLGLPISKELVALHGGQLFVTSEKGKGTRVTVALPVERRVG
jgi:PAS domain S-box-containing protein